MESESKTDSILFLTTKAATAARPSNAQLAAACRACCHSICLRVREREREVRREERESITLGERLGISAVHSHLSFSPPLLISISGFSLSSSLSRSENECESTSRMLCWCYASLVVLQVREREREIEGRESLLVHRLPTSASAR